MTREEMMDLIISRRGFVFIHLFHCHEVVHFRNNTARLKTIGLLTHSNEKCASHSSSDGERAVSAIHDLWDSSTILTANWIAYSMGWRYYDDG